MEIFCNFRLKNPLFLPSSISFSLSLSLSLVFHLLFWLNLFFFWHISFFPFFFVFATLGRLNYRFSLLLVDWSVILSRKNMRVGGASAGAPHGRRAGISGHQRASAGISGHQQASRAPAPVAGVNTVDNRLPVLQWNHVKYAGYATCAHLGLVLFWQFVGFHLIVKWPILFAFLT